MTDATESHAWWFDEVYRIFRFLVDDHGWEIAEARAHFQGDYVVYRGPDVVVMLEFLPDTNWLQAELLERHPEDRPWLNLADLLERLEPAGDWSPPPMGDSVDRPAIVRAMEAWAGGLRDVGPDQLVARLKDDRASRQAPDADTLVGWIQGGDWLELWQLAESAGMSEGVPREAVVAYVIAAVEQPLRDGRIRAGRIYHGPADTPFDPYPQSADEVVEMIRLAFRQDVPDWVEIDINFDTVDDE